MISVTVRHVSSRWVILLDGAEVGSKDENGKVFYSKEQARNHFMKNWNDAQELIDAGRVDFVQVLDLYEAKTGDLTRLEEK